MLDLTSLCKTVDTVVGLIYLDTEKAHWTFRYTLFSLDGPLPGQFKGTAPLGGVAVALWGLSVRFLVVSRYLVDD